MKRIKSLIRYLLMTAHILENEGLLGILGGASSARSDCSYIFPSRQMEGALPVPWRQHIRFQYKSDAP